MSDRKTLIRLASTLPKGSDERRAILAGLRKANDQKKWIKEWNRSGDSADLEAAGLADEYDELYSLTQKEEKKGELASRDSRRYVQLYDMLTDLDVEIRFGVNI
jgi:hypothetical protein